MQRCDSVVPGVARLGVFTLHIKACLRCVLARFSPGRLYGNLALSWTKLNCERAPFTNARMNMFTIMFIRQRYSTFSSCLPKIWTSSWTIVHWTCSGTTLPWPWCTLHIPDSHLFCFFLYFSLFSFLEFSLSAFSSCVFCCLPRCWQSTDWLRQVWGCVAIASLNCAITKHEDDIEYSCNNVVITTEYSWVGTSSWLVWSHHKIV